MNERLLGLRVLGAGVFLAGSVSLASILGCDGNKSKDNKTEFDYRAEKDGSVSKVSRPLEYLRVTGKPLSVRADIDYHGDYGYLGITLDESREGELEHYSNTAPTLLELKNNGTAGQERTKIQVLDLRNRVNSVVSLLQAEINDGDSDTISVETSRVLTDTIPSTLGHNSMRVYGIRKVTINSVEYDLTK